MRNILVIMKKELKRFFTDKRLLLSLILPGVIIFVVYSLMGSIVNGLVSPDKEHVSTVYVANKTEDFDSLLESAGIKWKAAEYPDADAAKEAVKDKKLDLAIVFEENFKQKTDNGLVPTVTFYYNSTEKQSAAAFQSVSPIISSTFTTVTVKANAVPQDMATKEDVSAMVITMILPMLVLMLLFSGCMAVATESIAGEKERGTIATLLITPVKRTHIAIGKILALSITALLSATVSFIGVFASLPKLMGGSGGNIDMSMYGFGTFAGTFGVILITVILFIVLLSVISTLAKSVKEASQYAAPVMIIVMVGALASSFGSGKPETWQYLIPVYNSALCLKGLFSFEFSALNFLLTVGVNAVLIAAGVFVLARLFNSEKIMFNK